MRCPPATVGEAEALRETSSIGTEAGGTIIPLNNLTAIMVITTVTGTEN